jgi:hypothetical protein
MNVPRAYSSAGFSKRRFSGALNDAVIRVYDAAGNRDRYLVLRANHLLH